MGASRLRNGRGHGCRRDDRFIGRRKERRRARSPAPGWGAVAFAGTVVGPAFIFARVSCCSFNLLLQRLHGRGKCFNLLTQGFDVVRRRRRRWLLGKNGPLRANQNGGDKRFLQDKFFSALSGA